MFGLTVTAKVNTKPVLDSAKDATFRNVAHAAASLRKFEISEIQFAPGPSQPGTPPHTHTQRITKKGKVRRGELPRSFAFDFDRASNVAVIGPRASVVGQSAAAQEFGGDYKGQQYPERTFAQPALEAIAPRFGGSFAGSIGE